MQSTQRSAIRGLCFSHITQHEIKRRINAEIQSSDVRAESLKTSKILYFTRSARVLMGHASSSFFAALKGQTTLGARSIHAVTSWRRSLAAAGTVCLVLFLFLSIDQPSWENEPQTPQETGGTIKRLSLEQLGNVEVTTASKEPEQVWRTPAAIYVITQEDIRCSGATSIPEILRLAPGVEVARIDSDHWAVGIRGFGGQFSKSLLVLIDGRSVYSPLFSGVYWQVQDTLLEDIERIEVIRGPGGTIWGANAVNGVINIITKNATDTHGGLVSTTSGNLDQGIGG